MLSSGVSDDLPLYLKSKFTVLNPPSPPKRPLKALKSILRQGVSSESPIFFQLGHVAILDKPTYRRELSGNDPVPGRFLNTLKQNTVNLKPRFDYTDSQLSSFDYHHLSPSKIIDLAADKSPRIKEQTKFHAEFSSFAQKGFGRTRGQFTIEATTPKVPRYRLGQIELLRDRLSLSLKREFKEREFKRKGNFNSTCGDLKERAEGRKEVKRRESTPDGFEGIDEFEKKQASEFWRVDRRKIYG
jgi:hypothetical protein